MIYLSLFFCLKIEAQQTPLFSAYHFNRFLVNPAFTGIDNEYRAFGFYRSQWGDMPGRPITGGATIEGSFWENRIGAGIVVMNDQIGIFNQTNVAVSYAQKIRFAKHHQISIGVQGAAFMNRIDFSSALATDFNDPSIGEQRPMKVAFDLNAGISYKWKTLLVGFCVPQVLQPNAKYTNSSLASPNYKYVRHYNAFAQYKINLLKEKFNITPTVFMRKGVYSGFQFDATLLLDYKNIVFAGAGYRNSFGVITMAGVNIFDMFTIAYAFDFTTQNELKGQVGYTHEITAGFHLATDYKQRKKEEAVAKADKLMTDLQRANDSLAQKLKLAKQKSDSLSKSIQMVADNSREKKIDSLENIIGKLFKNKPENGNGSSSQAYSLDKIYFEANQTALLDASKEQLDLLVGFLSQFPDVEIMIKGYADSTGSIEFNQALSDYRAKAVAEYLTENGIASDRLSYKGYGTENPIADNNSPEGRKMNRRVEFTITKQ